MIYNIDFELELDDFIEENQDVIFRLLVYRRIYTPYEQKECFMDESIYEDSHYQFVKLKKAIVLPNNNVMIEVVKVDPEDKEEFGIAEYYNINEIRLSRFDFDNREEKDEDFE